MILAWHGIYGHAWDEGLCMHNLSLPSRKLHVRELRETLGIIPLRHGHLEVVEVSG